jgi:catechol 2,3-dioxygenase-like lactoylglutathione lyase family enzyme
MLAADHAGLGKFSVLHEQASVGVRPAGRSRAGEKTAGGEWPVRRGGRRAWNTISRVLTAVHLLIYSDDAVATRSFLRDVLGWPYVEHAESAPGWLIFKSGPSEFGVHPTNETYEGKTYSHPRHHSISLMCDDIHATKTELESRGAEFAGAVEDMGFGLTVMLKVPGADDIMLYEPRHPEAHSL